MRKKNSGQNPIGKLLESRSGLFELFIVAIFVGFGVNIIASGIISSLSWGTESLIYGLFIVCLGFTYLLIKIFGRREIDFNTTGFLIYHKNDRKLIKVNRYRISESISQYLDALFVENKALEKLWNKEDFSDRYQIENGRLLKKEIRSDQLIREAIEYYTIRKLSGHLTDYFNGFDTKENLKTFSRREVPDVLLSNRFLELFSKPMEEREPFSDRKNDSSVGRTVMAYSKGAIFDYFELTLPRKSVIKRVGSNQVEIKTARFTMTINVDFDGNGEVLPYKFDKYYLGQLDFEDYSTYDFNVNVHIKFHIFSLISLKGWRYYKWVDSFLAVLDEDINQDAFFEKINWESTVTLIEIINKPAELVKEVAAGSE